MTCTPYPAASPLSPWCTTPPGGGSHSSGSCLGPNSIFVAGAILLVGAIAGGIVRLGDGTVWTGLLLLTVGIVGLVAMLIHLERRMTEMYVDHRDGEVLRSRSEDPDAAP